jgi:glycosyltransferase involved in cell wall biosynthesis
MVIQTLAALRRLNYPDYEIIAIDDNTDDPDLWRPVEQWCATYDVKFVHLENWPGYKSGALNYALDNLTDPRAELIAVVDSDYQIQPNFLADCAPLFADPGLGFLQPPQDYRGWRQSGYYRRLYGLAIADKHAFPDTEQHADSDGHTDTDTDERVRAGSPVVEPGAVSQRYGPERAGPDRSPRGFPAGG